MLHDSTVLERARTLGAVRSLIPKLIFEGAYAANEEEADAHARTIAELALGTQLIIESLGLELPPEDLLPSEDKYAEPAALLLDDWDAAGSVRDAIAEQFGDWPAFQFRLAHTIGTLVVLTSIFRWSFRGQPLAPRRRREVDRQRRVAVDACRLVGAKLCGPWLSEIELQLPESFRARALNLAQVLGARRYTSNVFLEAFEKSVSALTFLVPHFTAIQERRVHRRRILSELKACEPGRIAWRRYEEVCIGALRALFIPPFHKVAPQARTDRNEERRDAILPNNQFDGFWRLVREEFDARHIICEFKNVKHVDKDAINQLRIYLKKPTIGRFGLLFCREGASSGAAIARRNAYADDHALILIISDAVLGRLLLARAFLGSADAVLEDMKMDFEVAF